MVEGGLTGWEFDKEEGRIAHMHEKVRLEQQVS